MYFLTWQLFFYSTLMSEIQYWKSNFAIYTLWRLMKISSRPFKPWGSTGGVIRGGAQGIRWFNWVFSCQLKLLASKVKFLCQRNILVKSASPLTSVPQNWQAGNQVGIFLVSSNISTTILSGVIISLNSINISYMYNHLKAALP